MTPVCLTTIATGAHPDVHGIPHLVWYHRGEQRIIEYGSSFPALRAVGAQGLRDTVFNMTHAHMSPDATTIFEAVEDAALTPAAINFTCYRGRTRHAIRLPELAARNRWYEAVYGPKRFFFFNIFESDVTGAPLAIRSRVEGSIDDYAAAIGRWLVTRDGFDFLVFYLPDYDYASHLAGPARQAKPWLMPTRHSGSSWEAAGDLDVFLERYAVVVCSDHGQTRVRGGGTPRGAVHRPPRLCRPLKRRSLRSEVVITASNRAGMIYRLPACPQDARQLAERLDGFNGADVVLFREEGFVEWPGEKARSSASRQTEAAGGGRRRRPSGRRPLSERARTGVVRVGMSQRR